MPKRIKTPPNIVHALLGQVAVTEDEFAQLKGLDYEAASVAFTAKGLESLSKVSQLRDSLGKALEEGASMSGWLAGVPEILTKQMGEERLKLSYLVNIQSAYAKGRWQGIQETKETHPYLQYDALDDGRARPAHKALDGVVYPVDHPFWQSHYPPNGFRCRCSVRQLSRLALKRKGLKVSQAQPDAQPQPDTGWDRNVAEDWLGWMQGLETKKLSDLPLKIARAYIARKNAVDPTFAHFIAGQGALGEMRAVAVLAPNAAGELVGQGQLLQVSTDTLVAHMAKEVVPEKHRAYWSRHAANVHPEMVDPAFWRALPKILAQGLMVKEEGKLAAVVLGYKGDWYRIAIKGTGKQELLLTSAHKLSDAKMIKQIEAAKKKGDKFL